MSDKKFKTILKSTGKYFSISAPRDFKEGNNIKDRTKRKFRIFTPDKLIQIEDFMTITSGKEILFKKRYRDMLTNYSGGKIEVKLTVILLDE